MAGVRALVLGESRDDDGGEALEERGRPPTSAPTEEREEVEWLWWCMGRATWPFMMPDPGMGTVWRSQELGLELLSPAAAARACTRGCTGYVAAGWAGLRGPTIVASGESERRKSWGDEVRAEGAIVAG
jgi:hypothetical protein